MVAHSHRPLHAVGQGSTDRPDEVHDPELLGYEGANPATEPYGPADAQRHQLLTMVPPARQLAVLGGGAAAVLVGGTIGYWLGSRRAQRSPRAVRRAASTLDSAVALAPVAARLLANPLVRTMLVRIVLRQITRRMPS
ncbi:MAG: hypothetical protein U0893_12370 [Chloroflexota bacterium]